ncbi:large-conductance mechanosensitive channel protein MscL [Romboutsia lituseburensis]|uniref:Large-conductance mechanosensitive channel n=1 Tax=Romboutsia lituseburensis DSM 797 TaxID=1121325 RepID=A0A1G9N435_9FIRM|nr:large-conductance mechanosensitive channel protein MscL [Romboutsia lituseburensis]CEH34201.1 Large-conductance mechanosensitive channel [Romboutsia lituseburensis]SDL81248.1 large conductance mechanosensitive channel [Romboutsia lituseburensis DSM 797]
MKHLIKEFKEFAIKGNVIDLAIGVVVGGAFSKIVTSLVNDLIMPFVGILTGGINFSEYKVVLREGIGKTPPITLNIGSFIQTTVDFFIIAFAIFMFVRIINKLRTKKIEEAVTIEEKISEEVLLLRDIKELLQNK